MFIPERRDSRMAPFPTLSRDPTVQAYLKLSTSNVSDGLDPQMTSGRAPR